MVELGKLLIGIGVLLVVIGALLVFSGGLGALGRLPGDIHIQRGNWSFYFPLGTSIVISIVLSLILMLFSRR
jgi:hypothetical protein